MKPRRGDCPPPSPIAAPIPLQSAADPAIRKRSGKRKFYEVGKMVHCAMREGGVAVVGIEEVAKKIAEAGSQDSEDAPDTPVLKPNGAPIADVSTPEKRNTIHDDGKMFIHKSIVTPNSLPNPRNRMPPPSPGQELAMDVIELLQSSFDATNNCFTQHPPSPREICQLTSAAVAIFSKEPVLVDIESDAWIFGDIHGNFKDLNYFLTELIPFDVTLCPYRLVCLGDYVDRGPYSLQCFLLLVSLKILSPGGVVLLRGNHEDPAVCGDTNHYGEGSFKKQCLMLYGHAEGAEVFDEVCKIFTVLPLCGIVGGKVFCAHGGIPRVNKDQADRMQILRDPLFTRFPSLFANVEPYTQTEAGINQWLAAYDLLWSDPVRGSAAELDDHGFGPSERGGTSIVFSAVAVEQFLSSYGLSLMIRAHQEKRAGLRVSQSNQVITVFSSSNYQGHGNGAGTVLIRSNGKVEMLMKTTE